jgi:hypothetical protein
MTRILEHQFGGRFFLVKWLAIFSFVHSEVYRITVSFGFKSNPKLDKTKHAKTQAPIFVCT